MSDCPKCGVLNDCTCWLLKVRTPVFEVEPTNASYYRRELKKVQAELKELREYKVASVNVIRETLLENESLRAFKQKVMELEPVGCVCRCETGYENSIVKEDLDSYLSMSVPIYDLKGIKE